MADSRQIQWFPGHMAKTKRELQESIKLVDLAVEILDARIPFSSSNPDLNAIISRKARIVILNKSDLADDVQSKKWINFYKNKNIKAIPFSAKSGQGVALFVSAIHNVLKEKINAWKSKGIIGWNAKIMVVGIPNVGKSLFINRLAGKSKAKVENRPGVTRKNQWFSVDKNISLLDTPGVLWPKFEDKTVAQNLAFTGAIKDEILDTEELVVKFLDSVKMNYADKIVERYKIELKELVEQNGYELLEAIGKKRGMLISGGEIDTERTASMILDEFRSGRLGRITLEVPCNN